MISLIGPIRRGCHVESQPTHGGYRLVVRPKTHNEVKIEVDGQLELMKLKLDTQERGIKEVRE